MYHTDRDPFTASDGRDLYNSPRSGSYENRRNVPDVYQLLYKLPPSPALYLLQGAGDSHTVP